MCLGPNLQEPQPIQIEVRQFGNDPNTSTTIIAIYLPIYKHWSLRYGTLLWIHPPLQYSHEEYCSRQYPKGGNWFKSKLGNSLELTVHYKKHLPMTNSSIMAKSLRQTSNVYWGNNKNEEDYGGFKTTIRQQGIQFRLV